MLYGLLEEKKERRKREAEENKISTTTTVSGGTETDLNSYYNAACVVCQDNEKSIVLLPCKHLCLCEECFRNYYSTTTSSSTSSSGGSTNNTTCPLCRSGITDILNVYH